MRAFQPAVHNERLRGMRIQLPLLWSLGSTVMLLGSLGGCVSLSDGSRMDGQIEELQREVAALQASRQDEKNDTGRELDDLSRRMERLEQTLQSLRQSDADNAVQMEKVITELQALRGDIENIRYQLGETQTELGKTKTQLGETKKSVQDILSRPPPSVQAEKAAPSVSIEEKAQKADRDEIPTDKTAHYDLARRLFTEKKYVDSILAFDEFVARYPKDKELLDNAYFWMGEAHYIRAADIKDKKARNKSYKKAILSYQKVLDFAGSNKADGALLKIGLAFEKLGFVKEAKIFYEEVVTKHPKSKLVKQAKKRLKALK